MRKARISKLVPWGTARGPTWLYCTASMTVNNWVARIAQQVRIAMKIVLSALVALSVLAGIAPASAFDAKSLYGQLDRESGGGSQ
jgi:hypothetical protein